jgi:hypothetical protein
MLGMGGLIWAAINYMAQKNWTKAAISSVFCFAFGAVFSLIFTFATTSPNDLHVILTR